MTSGCRSSPCCSRDSVESCSVPATGSSGVWTAMTAWSAKVLSSAICGREKDYGSARDTGITPTTSWPRNIGIRIAERVPRSRAASQKIGPTDSSVSASTICCITHKRTLPLDFLISTGAPRFRHSSPASPPSCPAALPPRRQGQHEARRRTATPALPTHRTAARRWPRWPRTPAVRRLLHLADRAQDIRGGRLPLQRLAEVLVALLELGEQAHVLDGDHRLVGERLEERRPAYLRLGLRIRPEPRTDRPDRGHHSRNMGTARMLWGAVEHGLTSGHRIRHPASGRRYWER